MQTRYSLSENEKNQSKCSTTTLLFNIVPSTTTHLSVKLPNLPLHPSQDLPRVGLPFFMFRPAPFLHLRCALTQRLSQSRALTVGRLLGSFNMMADMITEAACAPLCRLVNAPHPCARLTVNLTGLVEHVLRDP